MTAREQLVALADEHLDPGDRDAWLGLLRPAAQLVPLQDGQRPAARMGGVPDLPAGVAWPTWQHGPLAFVASLDCAVLRATARGLLLPPDGTLLFFYWFDEASGVRCVLPFESEYRGGFWTTWVPAGTPTQPTPPPGGTTYGEGVDLAAREHWTLPSASDPAWEAAGVEVGWDLLEAVSDLTFEDGGTSTWVGGWTHDVQGPPALEVAPRADPAGDPSAVGADMRLVLQLDEDYGFNFGTGIAYWMARPQDVADGDWDRTLVTWQC